MIQLKLLVQRQLNIFLAVTRGKIMAIHKWSGWPGAYCLKCGAEHALENALAMNWYDPVTDTWDTIEHEIEVDKADGFCPVESERK